MNQIYQTNYSHTVVYGEIFVVRNRSWHNIFINSVTPLPIFNLPGY